jgi:hypothetical protein
MTPSRASLVGFLAVALITLGASVGGAASAARCSDGRWTIDDGPLTIGPLSIGVVALRDGVPELQGRPLLQGSCRALRWSLGRAEGETRLRALFACRAPEGTQRSRRFPLRLRARIVDGCARMEGAFAVRRFGESAHFTGTLTGGACASSADCAAEAYCRLPDGECAATGVCEPRPTECFGVYLTVCGCDGRTYSYCEAAIAGVGVAYYGSCAAACGGIAGMPCPTGEFCDLPAGLCGAADLDGRCVEISAACPEFYSPVCGCDGVTYANDCFRQAAQAQKAHDGPCVEPDCTMNGDCGEGAFCAKPLGECAGDGQCEARPTACPDVYLPVCGCDGQTYGNRCEAAAAGVSAAHEGECGGCTSLLDCPPNEFCQAPIGACGGRGDCTFIEQVCSGAEYDPICGCDGETYPSRCHAAMRAVSIAHVGTCEGVCGGIAGIPCPEGQLCELPAGMCHAADLQGRCVEPGEACIQVYDPVCGCDGQTYSNDCERQRAGAQKSHDGACECVPVCCTLRSEPVDTDGDGCGDVCVATSTCEVSCDCYPDPPFGNYKFCNECPLLCPNCGSYWACVDGTCVEQCGQLPPDVTICFEYPAS